MGMKKSVGKDFLHNAPCPSSAVLIPFPDNIHRTAWLNGCPVPAILWRIHPILNV
jgi:hypothetical protein